MINSMTAVGIQHKKKLMATMIQTLIPVVFVGTPFMSFILARIVNTIIKYPIPITSPTNITKEKSVIPYAKFSLAANDGSIFVFICQFNGAQTQHNVNSQATNMMILARRLVNNSW